MLFRRYWSSACKVKAHSEAAPGRWLYDLPDGRSMIVRRDNGNAIIGTNGQPDALWVQPRAVLHDGEAA